MSETQTDPDFMTPAHGRRVLDSALSALRETFEKHGLEVDAAISDRSPLEIRLSLFVSKPVTDSLRMDFEAQASDFGLNADDYGRVFPWDGFSWKIVGLDPRRRRNPVAAIMLPSGRSRWLPREAVWAIMQARRS